METKKILAFFSEEKIRKTSLLITILLFLIGFIWGYLYSGTSYGDYTYEPYRIINTYLFLFFVVTLLFYFLNFKVRLETLSGSLLWNYVISPIGFLVGGAVNRWIVTYSTVDDIPFLTKLGYHFDAVKVYTPLFLILPVLLFIGLFIQHYRIKDSDA